MHAAVLLLVAAALLATTNPCIHARTLAPSPEAEPFPGNAAAIASSPSADVIVIGAGMAGITTARWIVDNTNYSVIILEARERSGGRLYSVPTTHGKLIIYPTDRRLSVKYILRIDSFPGMMQVTST
jgi:hypothetical protein